MSFMTSARKLKRAPAVQFAVPCENEKVIEGNKASDLLSVQ